MGINSYTPPVDQLLTYGDAHQHGGHPQDWPQYLELGIGSEQIPDLIRMATDEELRWADSESLEVWAPIHAWRTLGTLHAEAAIEPLLPLLKDIDENDDDWVQEELPEVYGRIGPAAIPALAAYMADTTHHLWARVAVVDSLEKIAKMHPESRDECARHKHARATHQCTHCQEILCDSCVHWLRRRGGKILKLCPLCSHLCERIGGEKKPKKKTLLGFLHKTIKLPFLRDRLTKRRSE